MALGSVGLRATEPREKLNSSRRNLMATKKKAAKKTAKKKH
jgi:hypothetical protein